LFEEILNPLVKFGEQILQWLHSVNVFINEHFGGILLVLVAIGVAIALRKVGQERRERESVKQLAEAIIRQYNKELRGEK
jgi:hypothetical protein